MGNERTVNTWKIYYDDGTTRVGNADIFPDEIWGVQIILHNPKRAGWITEHGGDFYVQDGPRWFGHGIVGLLNHLKRVGLIRPVVGTRHEVLHNGEWVEVNDIGLYTWIEENNIALIGTIIDDDEFGDLMTIVLSDRLHVQEYGILPN